MKTWILVCDAASARLFESPGNIEILALIKSFDHPASRKKVSEQLSDRRGSTKTASGVHGGQPAHSSLKEVESQRFAQKLAHYINKRNSNGHFKRLILVAPPHFLGQINHCLSETALKLVSHSLDKDYTHLKDHELGPALIKYM
jgi:protein required for attachment to host cells